MFCAAVAGAKTDATLSLVAVRLLDHHDRIGAVGHRRAGRDLDALAGARRVCTGICPVKTFSMQRSVRGVARLAPAVSSARTA